MTWRMIAVALAAVVAGCVAPANDREAVEGGVTAFSVGEYGEAEDLLKEVVQANPDNGYALITLGNVYERIGRKDDARAAYAQAAARFGEIHAEVMGVRATEREALAALARERLERLQGQAAPASGGTSDASISPGTLKAVFVNLRKITDNLQELSGSVRDSRGGDNLQMTRLPEPEPAAPATTKTANGRGQPSSGIWLHLASYRSMERAKRGWGEVTGIHSDVLDGLGFDYSRIDFGAGMGVFFRVLAGPAASEASARSTCARMKQRGEYCTLVFF